MAELDNEANERWYRTVVRLEVLVWAASPENAEAEISGHVVAAAAENFFDEPDENVHLVGYRFERPEDLQPQVKLDPQGVVPPVKGPMLDPPSKPVVYSPTSAFVPNQSDALGASLPLE